MGAIQERVTVTVAEVDVNDEYRVELWQQRKRTDYSPEQARELVEDLLRAAIEAEVALEEHIVVSRRSGWVAPVINGEAVI